MKYLNTAILLLLFSSCSQPKKNMKILTPIKIIVFDFDNQISKDAKEANLGSNIAKVLHSSLSNQQNITIVRRPYKPTLDDEKIICQNKGECVDYYLKGTITNTTTDKVIYPSRSKSEGGTSAGWTEYIACVYGNVQLLKMSSDKVQGSFEFKNICIRQNEEKYIEMLQKTAPKIVESIWDELEESLNKGK